mmetsp:Transcript_56654/g.98711  ORF Transcript_56654/g.98711 Transcript_56654/m.98711 type:complete len:113 (-) Transcript_56654:9-347(-)
MVQRWRGSYYSCQVNRRHRTGQTLCRCSWRRRGPPRAATHGVAMAHSEEEAFEQLEASAGLTQIRYHLEKAVMRMRPPECGCHVVPLESQKLPLELFAQAVNLVFYYYARTD